MAPNDGGGGMEKMDGGDNAPRLSSVARLVRGNATSGGGGIAEVGNDGACWLVVAFASLLRSSPVDGEEDAGAESLSRVRTHRKSNSELSAGSPRSAMS
mmetsp:Transcript_51332/g.101691  ORF Transcript_51332/g.101691 Transcript_51332/m.101691 type:complete len:99 (-) Transcript_51332:586-882(-)